MQPVPRRLGPRIAAVLAWMAILSACSPGPAPATSPPAPTTAVVTVHIADELNLLRPVLAACMGEIPGAGLLVFEAPVPDLPEGAGELTLWFGEPPAGDLQAALLGFDEIIVVAAAAAGIGPLAEADVRALFAGGGLPDRDAVEIWLPQPGQAARERLDGWLAAPAYPPEAFLAPTAAAMVAAVSDNEKALGVIPAAWITDELESVFSLGELPVLALTDRVPVGAVRRLIGCLQINPVYGD